MVRKIFFLLFALSVGMTGYADKPEMQVNFYPEGGHIIEGLDCRIAFEVKDNDGTVNGTDIQEVINIIVNAE